MKFIYYVDNEDSENRSGSITSLSLWDKDNDKVLYLHKRKPSVEYMNNKNEKKK